MKSLYNSDYRYSFEATDLSEKTLLAVKNIMDEFVAKGYSPREISQIMQMSIQDLEIEKVL